MELLIRIALGAVVMCAVIPISFAIDRWYENRKERKTKKMQEEYRSRRAKEHEEFREDFKEKQGRYPTLDEVMGPRKDI